MKILLLILSLVLSLMFYGQNTPLQIPESHEVIGTNRLLNKAINCTIYSFPEKLTYFYLDTISGSLTYTFRDKETFLNSLVNANNSTMVSFDLKEQKVKWTKRFNYKSDWVSAYPNFIIQSNRKGSYALNRETGQEKWEIAEAINLVDSKNNVAIGYCNVNPYGIGVNTLKGIDINNGNVLWERKIKRDHGWGDVRYLNDHTLIIKAQGLHTLNPKDGTGWDFKTQMWNMYGWNVSDVLIDSTNYYFASSESLTCLDFSGKVKWAHFFMPDLIGRPEIFLKDRLVYMINNSIPNDEYTKIKCGESFIAAYNYKDGKEIYYNMVSYKYPICDWKLRRDTLLLVFKDRISKYSLKNGQQIQEKSIQVKNGNQLFFVGRHVFIRNSDSTYNRLILTDTTQVFLSTEDKKVLAFDSKLNVVKQLDFSNLFVPYLKTEGYIFLEDKEKTTVLDKNYKEIATLNLKGRSKLIGTKLYNINENKLIIADLKDIMNP